MGPRSTEVRRTSLIDTGEVRSLVLSSWRRYSDGTGRPALITDTIPGMADEIDTLRAVEAGVAAIVADPETDEVTRARLQALLDAEPVSTRRPLV